MTIALRQHVAKRIDRYNDWERATRSPDDDKNAWCLVSLVVKTDGGRELANLEELVRLLDAGEPTLRMSADERQRLEQAIADRQGGLGRRSDLSIFAYMREDEIYEVDGAYGDTAFYQIVFAGPPITHLGFNADVAGNTATVTDRRAASIVVGVIDDGIGFANEKFRTANGRGTRIDAIWLQDVERFAGDDAGVEFGRCYNRRQINRLFAEADFDEREVYRLTGQTDFSQPQRKPLALRASHGTHVLDHVIGRYADEPGVTGGDGVDRQPGEPFVACVQVPTALIAEWSPVAIGAYVLQAFRRIMVWADQVGRTVPLVINMSFGNSAGPKDGHGLIEREMARLAGLRIAEGGPTVVVLPAGNTHLTRATAKMALQPAGDATASAYVDWRMLPDDHTPNFIEIWLPDCDADGQEVAVALSIVPPIAGHAPLAVSRQLGAHSLHADGEVVGYVYVDLVTRPGSDGAVSTARGRLIIALNPTARHGSGPRTAPAGFWRLELDNASGSDVAVQLFIQRDDTPRGHVPRGRQSLFDHEGAYQRDPGTGAYTALLDHAGRAAGPVTHEATLSAIGNGEYALLVGAADERDGIVPSEYTSSGPTDARRGPDLSAIVDQGPAFRGRIAAGTYSGASVAISGTSLAAPQIAREIVRLHSEGRLAIFSREEIVAALCPGDDGIGDAAARLGRCVVAVSNAGFERLPPRRYAVSTPGFV